MQKANEYRQVDLDYRMHQVAYLSFLATGKKKSGKFKEKPVYPTFQKFFDYAKELKRVDNRKRKTSPHIEAMRRMEKEHDV